ncbi:MAG: DUF6732 family protein [Pseudomonadota bacterium]
MRVCLAVFMITTAGPAAAHPGHFADLAGHSHWIALGALVIAGVLAAVLAGKKSKEAEADDEMTEEETEETAA